MEKTYNGQERFASFTGTIHLNFILFFKTMSVVENPVAIPFELIVKICSVHKQLFLLNKKYTEEHLKIKYREQYNFSTLPIYTQPLYPYHSYINRIHLKISTMAEMDKWKVFPFLGLFNCTEFHFYVASGILDVHLSSHILVILNKIRIEIPNLEIFKCIVPIPIDNVLKVFENSKLYKMFIPNWAQEIDLLNTMQNLSNLWVQGITSISNEIVLPRIKTLQTNGFEYLTNEELSEFLGKLSIVFPNLKEYMATDNFMPLNDILSLIPNTVDTLQLVLYICDNTFSTCKTFHDTVVFSFARAPEQIHLKSMVDYFRRCSRVWIFVLRNPFLIITNMKGISQFSKFEFALSQERIDSLVSLNDLISDRDGLSVYISKYQNLGTVPSGMEEMLAGFGLYFSTKKTNHTFAITNNR